MKVQYGDKFKIIPKKYGDIKDIGKHFMSDKLWLISEERTLLEKILNKGIYALFVKEWEDGLSPLIIEYMKQSPIESIGKIIRRNEDSYYNVVLQNGINIRCEKVLYEKAKKAGLETFEIKRSF